MAEITYEYTKVIDDMKEKADSLRFEKIQLAIKHDKLQETYTALQEAKKESERELSLNYDRLDIEYKTLKHENEQL